MSENNTGSRASSRASIISEPSTEHNQALMLGGAFLATIGENIQTASQRLVSGQSSPRGYDPDEIDFLTSVSTITIDGKAAGAALLAIAATRQILSTRAENKRAKALPTVKSEKPNTVPNTADRLGLFMESASKSFKESIFAVPRWFLLGTTGYASYKLGIHMTQLENIGLGAGLVASSAAYGTWSYINRPYNS